MLRVVYCESFMPSVSFFTVMLGVIMQIVVMLTDFFVTMLIANGVNGIF
jgi:hypothetical protein